MSPEMREFGVLVRSDRSFVMIVSSAFWLIWSLVVVVVVPLGGMYRLLSEIFGFG